MQMFGGRLSYHAVKPALTAHPEGTWPEAVLSV